jgi:hypothetical protein
MYPRKLIIFSSFLSSLFLRCVGTALLASSPVKIGGGSPRGGNLHKKVHGNVSIRGGRSQNNEQKSAGGVGMRNAAPVTPSPTKTEENKGKSSGSRFFGRLRFF